MSQHKLIPARIATGPQFLIPDGTVALPGIAFLADQDTGFWRVGSGQIGVSSNGGAAAVYDSTGINLVSSGRIGFSSGDPSVSASDTNLYRGAARYMDQQTKAQGAAADQFHRIWGFSGVPASNFERLAVGYDGTTNNEYLIQTQAGGSGTDRPLTFGVASGRHLFITATGAIGIGGSDVLLNRDAANVLAQRNGTTAQVSGVYTTFTTLNTNYRRLAIVGDFEGTGHPGVIGDGTGATGANTNMYIGTYGTGQLKIWLGGSLKWNWLDTGHLTAQTDNSYNIGGTTTRPASIFAGTNILLVTTAPGTSGVGVLGIGNGTVPSTSPADMIQIFSVDLSAGNATLGLRTETAVAVDAAVISTHTLTIKINGTNYRVLLAT